MLKYITSISLLLIAGALYGQQATVKVDTTKKKSKFIPTGVRVGVGTIHLYKSFFKEGYKEYSFQGDIDFHKYFLNVEYGLAERTLTSEDGEYALEGSYLRIGPDINFLHRDPDNSVLFFGLRYGMSTFSDKIGYAYEDAVYGEGTVSTNNEELKADWYEMVAGLKVKMWKMLWLGYTARFKFSVDTFQSSPVIPHQIPGYGRADKKSTWEFNYYLIFRIPLRKVTKPMVFSTESR